MRFTSHVWTPTNSIRMKFHRPQVEGSGFEDLLNIDWAGTESFRSILTNDLVYNQLNQSEVLQIEAGAVQKAKEESQSINKELNQIMSILEKKDQLMKNLNVYLLVAKMLEKVVKSCSSIAANDILNIETSNLDQGYHGVGSVTVEREEGQLRLEFLPAPVHNQEMISEENQSKKVTLTIETVAGRLAEIKLANPDMIFWMIPVPSITTRFLSVMLIRSQRYLISTLKLLKISGLPTRIHKATL